MRKIVKVQIALAHSGDGQAEAYVYDRNRDHAMLVPVTDYLIDLMGGAPKAYFDAEWTGYGWRLHGKVDPPDW